MPYNEFKLTRTTPSQLRGIQESYYYDANDETLSEVLATGYFTGFPCEDGCETIVTVNASDGWANVHPDGDGGASETVNVLIGDKTAQEVSDGVDSVKFLNSMNANKDSGILLPEDPTVATLTEGGVDAALTQFIRADTNPEKFTHSAAISEELNGRQVRLYTTTVNGTGNVGTGKNQTQPSWEFYTDALNIMLEVRQVSEYNIQIDDIFQSKGTSTIPSDGNNDNTILLNFADKRIRKVTLNFSTSASGFSGVYILPTDTVWPVEKTISMCIFGDSFSTGTLPNPAGLAWSAAVPKIFGIIDYQVSGVGGTGFINDAGDQTNYAGRFSSDCAYRDFDIIVASTSTNDGNASQEEIEAAVDEFYSLVKSSQPNALIVIIGSARSVTTATANTISVEGWALDRFNSKSDNLVVTIPVLTNINPPVFGTGRDNAATGDGNADIYVSSDGLHYNLDGHAYYAEWVSIKMISAIQNKIKSLQG